MNFFKNVLHSIVTATFYKFHPRHIALQSERKENSRDVCIWNVTFLECLLPSHTKVMSSSKEVCETSCGYYSNSNLLCCYFLCCLINRSQFTLALSLRFLKRLFRTLPKRSISSSFLVSHSRKKFLVLSLKKNQKVIKVAFCNFSSLRM